MERVLKAIALLKVMSSLVMLEMHFFIGLWSPLLESEDVQWGLFEWCSVEEGKTIQCHQIYRGESPAYFEVARFSVAFSFVTFFLGLPIFIPMPADKSISKWRLKRVLIWLPLLNVGTTLGLLAAYYKEDDRWKDSNPSLNGAFYFIAALAVVDFVLTCFFFVFYFACVCQRQGRHSRPPPNAEPISNQGEKNQTLCCQRLNSAKIKASILWKQLCRKLVTAMKRLKASICGKRHSRKLVMTMGSLKARSSGKHLSRKLVITMESLKASILGKRLSRKLAITMERLGPGTVQDLSDNPLRHQTGQPMGHGSPPIRHASGGPAVDLPPGIVQNDASDTSSVRASHSEGAARYNAADAYRSGGTTIHQTAGQDDVSRYTTMDSVIHQTAGQGEVSRYTTMDSVIPQGAPPEWSGRSAAMDPVIGQGGQGELSRSHSARDVPRVHSICRPQLTLADFHSFVAPQTNRLIFQLRHPGHRGTDLLISTNI